MIQDNADKIDESLKTEVESKIAAVRSALQGGDIASITTASNDLQTAIQQVGQAVYAQAGAPGQPGGAPGDMPPDDGTVEGEYREVDPDERN